MIQDSFFTNMCCQFHKLEKFLVNSITQIGMYFIEFWQLVNIFLIDSLLRYLCKMLYLIKFSLNG